ncbi:MAG: ArsB/NhaD family transporter [Peptostreptococcaceae bacterium]|nr:ArsB/NhaD family transporter [Peptostreptococcaceae bacterium]
MLIVVLIFVTTYIIIISEKINRTSIALLGAVLLMIFNIINQEEAINHIDFNTIGLLIGMMIVVNIMKRSGIFTYVAIRAAKIAKGDPWKIIVVFSIITAVFSALLDNVTTILLVVPVTLVITDTLEMNPTPFLIPMVLFANIGGTATLIGDPPNIMIGSAAGLGFTDFLLNLGPVVLVIFIVTILILKYTGSNNFHVDEVKKKKIMAFDEKLAIKDLALLKKSLFVLAMTIVGFMFHQSLGYDSATIALLGASVLLVISQIDPEEVLIEIEWPTIFFFVALFILVGGLQEVGIIDFLASKLLDITNGNLFATTMFVLWGSAIASAFLDNIPFVATMIPLIKSIAVLASLNVTPLWWALALGACLGGNGTLIGASANVIVGGMLEKHGYKLSFAKYMKTGFPIMLVSISISSVYLAVFYF